MRRKVGRMRMKTRKVDKQAGGNRGVNKGAREHRRRLCAEFGERKKIFAKKMLEWPYLGTNFNFWRRWKFLMNFFSRQPSFLLFYIPYMTLFFPYPTSNFGRTVPQSLPKSPSMSEGTNEVLKEGTTVGKRKSRVDQSHCVQPLPSSITLQTFLVRKKSSVWWYIIVCKLF